MSFRYGPKFSDVANLDNVVTAADGATVTFDCSLGNVHQVTLGGNRTLALGNITPGRTVRLIIRQDATGSRLVSAWPATVKWKGGGAPTLTTTANKSDLITLVCVAAGSYLGIADLNF